MEEGVTQSRNLGTNAELRHVKVKINLFGINEMMVSVSASQGLLSDHRPCVQRVPSEFFYSESKAYDHLWLGRSGEGSWHLLSRRVVRLLRTCDCHWCDSEMKKQV